jgi:hypothetical protein
MVSVALWSSIAMLGALSAPAFAASRTSSASAQARWQHTIAQLATPGSGCFDASYPALRWHATPCAVAPQVAYAPASPQAVGDGKDYSAVVTGLISKATGTFTNVSPNITEKGKPGNQGAAKANTFSLQLNSEFFSSPRCSGASKPAKCVGWEQFVYTTAPNDVFMQYWMLDYDTNCPSGWFTYNVAGHVYCYTNSPAAHVKGGAITAKDLARVQLAGQAVAGGNDQVSLALGSGKATAVSNRDNVVTLASSWHSAEFGVYGDGGGGSANFGKNTTLQAQTTLIASTSAAPKCVKEGFTGETNNLNLVHTPALGSQPSPTIASRQTNAAASKASCASAPGT